MSQAPVKQTGGFDVSRVRRDFPILDQQVNGQPLVYLDNAASTQKPLAVIDAISDYYRHDHSNVHRGVHALADRATRAFEQARVSVQQFINAASSDQIIWTRGTTESINLVAASFGGATLKPGDRILVSYMEHHSNIVPWQLAARHSGAELVPIPVTEAGDIDMQAYDRLLEQGARIVAVTHVSNALGTVNPLRVLIDKAHAVGAVVLVDGAQGAPHFPVDVQALDCDFYAFSGHKLYGPTGIGVLYGKRDLLEAMPPYQSGGEMIETVRFEKTSFNKLPYKFEAGTPHIAGVIGLGAAVGYLDSLDRLAAVEHEKQLLAYAHRKAEEVDGLKRVGRASEISGVFSFLLEGAHPADIGMLLDQQGVAVRSGDHCTQPLMAHYGIPGTVRASFSIYNTMDDVDRLFAALAKARELLL